MNKNLGVSILTLILLFSTVFFSCKKTKQPPPEPTIHYNGQYMISRINVLGQPVPNNATEIPAMLREILLGNIRNTINALPEDQKMAGVFVMSELAKGLKKYMQLYPNDIDADSPISTNTAAFAPDEVMTTYQVYDAVFNNPTNEGLLKDFLLIASLPTLALLPPNVDFTSLIKDPANVKLVYGYYRDFTTQKYLTGLFIVNRKNNKNFYVDHAIFNDVFIPMMIRMLTNHGMVSKLEQLSTSWILAGVTNPTPEELLAHLGGAVDDIISALVSETLTEVLHILLTDPINKILSVIHNSVYDQIGLKFEDDTQIRVLASGAGLALNGYDVVLPMRVHADPQFFTATALLSSWIADSKLPDLPITLKVVNHNAEGMRLVVPKESVIEIVGILNTSKRSSIDGKLDLGIDQENIIAIINGVSISLKMERKWLALFILWDELNNPQSKSSKAISDLLPKELISIDLYKLTY